MKEPRQTSRESDAKPEPGYLEQPRIYEGVLPIGLPPLHPPRGWEDRVRRVQNAYQDFRLQAETKSKKKLPKTFSQAKCLVKALADGKMKDERERLPKLRKALQSLEGEIARFENFLSNMGPAASTVAERFCRGPEDLLYGGKKNFIAKLHRLRRRLAERLESMEEPPSELKASLSRGAHARTWLREPIQLLEEFWMKHVGQPIPTSLKTSPDKIEREEVQAFEAVGPEFVARLLIAADPTITREKIATALRARDVKPRPVQE